MEIEVRRPPAEVDLVAAADEAGTFAAGLPFGLLPADFSTDRPHIRQEPDTADHHWRDFGAVGNEAVAEDGAVVEIDELAGFAVAPVDDPGANPDVGLHCRVTAGGNEADAGGDGDETQLELLLDLAAVVVHHVRVDARHRAL